MEKTQAFFISKKISEATSAENLAQILKEMGFNSSYLSLADKKPVITNIFNSVLEEEKRAAHGLKTFQIPGKESYSLEDLYLVRATDVFNVGHLLTTPRNGQILEHKDFDFRAYSAAKKHILPADHTYQDSIDKQSEIKDLEEKITPFFRYHRSTKHFTINTFVSANGGGSWDHMPYILLEPMQPHLQDKHLVNIAPHDTFFRGDVQLKQPTLIIQQKYLSELLSQNNPAITQTLIDTELIILDDNSQEYGSPDEHVAYVLRELKQVPYYRCDEHGIKNFSSDEGVYAPLSQFAAEKGISYNVDHFYSPEKQMDLLHFQRNMAEDSYRYLTFVRNNPKLNLTDDQIAIMDYAIERYHQTCEYALSKDIPLDFTEENTPNATYEHLQQHGRHADYNRSFEIFGELYCIVEDAFTRSEFYETVDISVLAEETTRYNAEYKAALEKSAEYSRSEFFKPEIPPTPVEE